MKMQDKIYDIHEKKLHLTSIRLTKTEENDRI